MKKHFYIPELSEEEHKVLLNFSLLLMLGVSFTLKYVGQLFYSEDFLKITKPGFWLLFTNTVFLSLVVLANKTLARWSWSDLGLAKPRTWWQPLLVAAGTFLAVLLLSAYIQPFFLKFGAGPDISHLMVLQQNLPLLLFTLLVTWITAAFLEELVFRAFLIKALEILLGKTVWATAGAVLFSSVLFGLIHAWQGLPGILTTASIGVIFGVAFILNGRRIWSLIFIHGVIDTISLVSIYNM